MNIINLLSRVASEEATGPEGHRGQEGRVPSSDRVTRVPGTPTQQPGKWGDKGNHKERLHRTAQQSRGRGQEVPASGGGDGKGPRPQDAGPACRVLLQPTRPQSRQPGVQHPWTQHGAQRGLELRAPSRAPLPNLGQATLLPEDACQGLPWAPPMPVTIGFYIRGLSSRGGQANPAGTTGIRRLQLFCPLAKAAPPAQGSRPPLPTLAPVVLNLLLRTVSHELALPAPR